MAGAGGYHGGRAGRCAKAGRGTGPPANLDRMSHRPLSALLLLCWFVLPWCAGCAAAPPPRVLLLGDSISMGYTPVVQELLAGRAQVVRPTHADGRAENCEGTTRGVREVERWLALEGGGWDLVHVNFGLHDLKRVDAEGRNSDRPEDPPQADLARYREQLTTILDRLVESGARVVVATTTPVPTGGVRPHRDPADVPRYNAIAVELARERGLVVDDLFALVERRLAELQRPVDVHFTPEGSRVLGEEVARCIERELESGR